MKNAANGGGVELASSPVAIGQAEGKSTGAPVIYWHRDLPPLDAVAIREHVVEANSRHVPGTLAHRDELWKQCYEDLMEQVRDRLEQEVARLGGNYARVLRESVDSKHSDAPREAWLHGRFTYMLYARR
jgi:hypothetical protein